MAGGWSGRDGSTGAVAPEEVGHKLERGCLARIEAGNSCPTVEVGIFEILVGVQRGAHLRQAAGVWRVWAIVGGDNKLAQEEAAATVRGQPKVDGNANARGAGWEDQLRHRIVC